MDEWGIPEKIMQNAEIIFAEKQVADLGSTPKGGKNP